MKNDNGWLKYYARIGHFAFLFPAAVLAGYFVGNWLDAKLNTEPLFILTLIILGFAAAFRALLKELDNLDNDNRK